MADKIETMLNFAIRAKKAVYGVDNIVAVKKVKIAIICRTLSPRSEKNLISQITVPVIRTISRDLADVCHKSGKAIGITDPNMTAEILKNINFDYELISEGK